VVLYLGSGSIFGSGSSLGGGVPPFGLTTPPGRYPASCIDIRKDKRHKETSDKRRPEKTRDIKKHQTNADQTG
jgi:hypothetical protein